MGLDADFASNVAGAIFGFVGLVSGAAGGLYAGKKIGSYAENKKLATVLLDIVLVPVCAIPTAIYSAKAAYYISELERNKKTISEEMPAAAII